MERTAPADFGGVLGATVLLLQCSGALVFSKKQRSNGSGYGGC